MKNLSDVELIEAYQQDYNNAYIGVLYKRYMNLVYGVCYKYLGNHHDAEDATVHIFTLIMDKLKEVQVTYFKSWLYIVSKNYAVGILRKQKSDRLHNYTSFEDEFMEIGDDSHLNIEELIKKDDSESLLKQGIHSLKEAQQVCVELFYLQSKSYLDVANITGFEVKQVKSHIQNGKRNLKMFLESKGYQHG